MDFLREILESLVRLAVDPVDRLRALVVAAIVLVAVIALVALLPR